ANAVLGVVEPTSCGIGGDLLAIYWHNDSQKLYGVDASGRPPPLATREHFENNGPGKIPEPGPLSGSAPGCLSGWNALRDRFGSRTLRQTLAPAIDLAEQGFPVTEIIGASWAGSEKLLTETENAARAYLRKGELPKVGQRMTN